MSEAAAIEVKNSEEGEKETQSEPDKEVAKVKRKQPSKSLSSTEVKTDEVAEENDETVTESPEKDHQEVSGRSESVPVDNKKLVEEKFIVQSNEIRVVSSKSSFSGRTKSLENIEAMTPHGDLILDRSVTESNLNQANKPTDQLYKILVIGDLGTGKTSIIKRYVHRFYTQHYRATIGVDFALKVLNWDQNTLIRLQLWDIAGQERYGNMTRVYYKEAVAAFVVFDVTRRNTFESVTNWKSDLDNKVQLPDGSPIPCILLANKCDQQKEGIVNFPNKMKDFCQENGFAAWFETSAKDNINIDEAAKLLVEKILACDSLQSVDKKSTDHFSLTQDSIHPNGHKSCSC